MFKIITAVAAFATLTAATLAPAHAIIVQGGNGVEANALHVNALHVNALHVNALHVNGLTTSNSLALNGLNSGNGPQANGTVESQSDLVIQAIELPPQSR
ncbi:MAG: hypothetical protein J0H97_04050 [Alphaproteobacteria bacterium]|jgi:hypothetical protein|nr:hypothetical protein [Alphaproteobacteria bacterium]